MKVTVPCKNDTSCWEASINEYQSYSAYSKMNVTGRGSSIDILYGATYDYNWVALPVQGIATTIAGFDDIFWNYEKLNQLIGEVDAMTIASALTYIPVIDTTIQADLKTYSKK